MYSHRDPFNDEYKPSSRYYVPTYDIKQVHPYTKRVTYKDSFDESDFVFSSQKRMEESPEIRKSNKDRSQQPQIVISPIRVDDQLSSRDI